MPKVLVHQIQYDAFLAEFGQEWADKHIVLDEPLPVERDTLFGMSPIQSMRAHHETIIARNLIDDTLATAPDNPPAFTQYEGVCVGGPQNTCIMAGTSKKMQFGDFNLNDDGSADVRKGHYEFSEGKWLWQGYRKTTVPADRVSLS